MSIILDGLKKLEESRKRDAVPNLLTVHSQIEVKARQKQLWPYIITAALLINALLIVLWLRPWETKKETSVSLPEKHINNRVIKTEPAVTQYKPFINYPENNLPDKKTASKTYSADNPVINPEKNIEPIKLDKNTESTKQEETSSTSPTLISNPENEDVPEQAPPADPSVVVELNELPSSVRSEIPEIAISGHIYSNNPSSRIVTINGQVFREGGKIIPGLVVDEITISGVILRYHDYRFRIRGL
ncbi:MAG: general secretion pathway protein GspB [Nitrospirae bacterium]|nr:general secretion pathway protein GspB [Nitrospirota bacterium]